MSRKDFELIAKALSIAKAHATLTDGDIGAQVVADTTNIVAIALAKTNPRFDMHRFLDAATAEVAL